MDELACCLLWHLDFSRFQQGLQVTMHILKPPPSQQEQKRIQQSQRAVKTFQIHYSLTHTCACTHKGRYNYHPTSHRFKRTSQLGVAAYSFNCSIIRTEKFAVVTPYSYFPALLDHTISIACELVSNVNASVTIDLPKK